MGILDDAQPNKRYDRTHAALMELPPADRKQIVDAILNETHTHVFLAERLTAYTSHEVDDYSVSRFKRKYKKGEVTV